MEPQQQQLKATVLVTSEEAKKAFRISDAEIKDAYFGTPFVETSSNNLQGPFTSFCCHREY